MPVTCIIVGCGSRGNRDKVSFHCVPDVVNSKYFPHLNNLSRERRQRWISAIKRIDLTPSILRNQRVCSRHFLTGKPSKLEDVDNPDWAPSQHLGHMSQGTSKRKDATERKMKVDKRRKLLSVSRRDEQEIQPEIATPTSIQPYPGGGEVVRQAFRLKNMPEETIETCIGSISSNTLRQYDSTYKEWWKFCNERKVGVFSGSVPEVLQFLQHMFNSTKWKYATFNSCRAALSLILPGDIGKDLLIRRFLKGIARARPTRLRHGYVWDPKIVLDYLGKKYPNEELSQKDLGMKLITLLTLVTGQRIQALSLIRVDQIFIKPNNIQITIPDGIKTSGPRAQQPCLCIPYFTKKPELCVASTLLSYIERTTADRDEFLEYLFISERKPYKNLNKQTLARWVKMVLKEAGVDTRIFAPRSTRHVATSKAWSCEVTVDTIRKTVGWSEASRTFAKFYNRPFQDQSIFAKAAFETT